MSRRYFASTAVATTIPSGCSSGATSLTVGSVTGWPGSYPFTAIIDPDTASEEVVEVTAGSGTSWSAVTRGVDGTSAVSHSAGAVVRHGVSARDFDEPNAHVNASVAVHGLSGTVVGTSDTQVLTNKTLTGPMIVDAVVTGTLSGAAGFDPWTYATVSLSSDTGAPTSGDAYVRYARIGKVVIWSCVFGIASKGSASGTLYVPLPFTVANGAVEYYGVGRSVSGGSTLNAWATPNASAVFIRRYDNESMCYDGAQGGATLVYEAA